MCPVTVRAQPWGQCRAAVSCPGSARTVCKVRSAHVGRRCLGAGQKASPLSDEIQLDSGGLIPGTLTPWAWVVLQGAQPDSACLSPIFSTLCLCRRRDYCFAPCPVRLWSQMWGAGMSCLLPANSIFCPAHTAPSNLHTALHVADVRSMSNLIVFLKDCQSFLGRA